MDITIELLQSNEKIEQMVLSTMAAEIDKRFVVMETKLKKSVPVLVKEILRSTDTYQSLANGELSFHFGFRPGGGKRRADRIIEAFAKNIEVRKTKIGRRGKQLIGGILISIGKSGFDDLFSLGEAVVGTEKGQQLEWLEWMLTRGDSIIISDYEIELVSGRGRSGGAIMVKNDAGTWRVPPRWAGTINNNWFTRTLRSPGFQERLTQLIRQELERRFR